MKKLAQYIFGAAMLAAAVPAVAADLPNTKGPAAAPVVDFFNPWMLRVRLVGVLPTSSGTVYNAAGPIAGSNVRVTNSIVPEIDISYFFTKNIAVEAICCVTPHTVNAAGSIAGLGQIGKTIAFPPTVLLQYHFTDFGAFKPYVGVGVNYTHYFGNGSGPLFANLSIKDSWGVAGQVGFDYMIDKHWGFNVDVKKLLMQPNATVTLLPATPLTAKVKIDPWIVGMGVTYRF